MAHRLDTPLTPALEGAVAMWAQIVLEAADGMNPDEDRLLFYRGVGRQLVRVLLDLPPAVWEGLLPTPQGEPVVPDDLDFSA